MKLKKVLTNPLSGLTLAAAVTLVFNSHQVLAEESNTELNTFEVVGPTLEATAMNAEESVAIAESAELDEAYNAPESSEHQTTPASVDSNEIINVQPVWDTKHKGEGTIVAIIDSGLDIEHDVLKITDMSKAKYKNEAELNAAKEKAGINYGKWYNDKVVFGYNYSDADHELKEEKEASHGMHVAGIAAGNPSAEDESTKRLIYGVAPEAQLMFLRVFSDRIGPSTNSTLYSRAIRDAVQLGADSINLSLGGGSGSLNDVDEDVVAAIEYARRAGVTVVIAAGNDGVFGDGRNRPKAESPDYGVVADPAVARDSIAVASFNNGTTVAEAFTVVGGEQNENFDKGKISAQAPSIVNVRFDATQDYDYEFVGLGQPEDLEGKDLTGKVALIKRGAITFNDKIRNAQSKGAVGVVVFDHTPGSPPLVMSLEESAAEIPSLMISSETGEELAKHAGTYKLRFSDKPLLLTSKRANKFSDFTSWGLSADGELKPDVSAPGGDIYSSINDGKYATMSGTSMAAPHVAGVAALLKQVYKEKYPDITGADMEALIKHMMMSTATPHVDLETNAYTSPRRQGAGIVNVEKAANSTLYVTGMDDYGSVSLGNVTDTITFNVKVHNISDEARELEYVTHLNTDNVAEGRITLTPRELTKVEGSRITVPAKGHVVVPITLSATQFAEELSKSMPNGYYLEGFVRFLNPSDKSQAVSIPFVGFRGDFQALPVVEKPIYDFANDDAPFYYDRNPQDPELMSFVPNYSFYTALLSTISEEDPEEHTNSTPSLVTLGSFEHEDNDGRFYLKRYDNGKPVLAVSPNGDANRDEVAFQGVFLRNASDIHIKVYAKDDTEQTTPLWESGVEGAYKNYFSGNPQNERATLLEEDDMVFAGYDSQGNKLADGEYKYVITYYPHIPGADQQRQEFDLVIDTVQPVVPKGGTYDETSRQFKPYKVTDDRTGIYRERIYYFETVEGQKVRFYVEKNEDGTYTLPSKNSKEEELTNDKFWFEAEDLAGNRQTVNVGLLIEVGENAGVLNVKLVDHETLEPVSSNFRYIIRNVNGEVVESDSRIGDKKGSTHRLPYGTYDVSLLLFDESGVKLVDKLVKRVTITKDNAEQDLVFKVEEIRRALTRIEFPAVMPEDTRVFLVDAEGNATELPRARYNGAQFEKRVLLGEYSVVVNLPAGYFLNKEDLVYTIDGEERQIKQVTVNAKGDLTQGGAAAINETTLPTFDETSTESVFLVGTGVTHDPTLPTFDETAPESVSLVGTSVTHDPTLPTFDATSTESVFLVGTGVTYELPTYDEKAAESVSLVGTGVTHELPVFDATAPESVSLVGTSVTHDPTLPTFDETSAESVALVGSAVTHELPVFDETAPESVSLVGTSVAHDPTLPTFDATTLPLNELSQEKGDHAKDEKKAEDRTSKEATSVTTPVASTSTKSSQALPETGESTTPFGLLGMAVVSILASLGLTKFKKDDEIA